MKKILYMMAALIYSMAAGCSNSSADIDEPTDTDSVVDWVVADVPPRGFLR